MRDEPQDPFHRPVTDDRMHCPSCETEITSGADVTFTDVDSTTGFFRAAKRYYTAECAACGESLGGGVAGARANGAAAAGGAH